MAQIAYMDRGRVLIARALVQGLTPAETLTHLAVGDGVFDPDAAIDTAQTGLVHEIGRAIYLRRAYVVEVTPPAAGPIVLGTKTYRESVVTVDGVQIPAPTNLLYAVFRFASDEANGNWTEYGLFGGGVQPIVRGAVLSDGNQGGDDRANRDVMLGGSYGNFDSQTVTVTVVTGGGSGVAQVGWVSDGSILPTSLPRDVDFGTRIFLTNSDLTLTFDGGVDGVLTLGDQWKIRATCDPQSDTFAAGGLYDPVTNRGGQVRVNGELFRVERVSPADVKDGVVVDVQVVTPILR